MRSVLTTGGIPTFISNEEHTFLESCGDEPVFKSQLDEREQEIARKLNGRGVLQRFRDTGKGLYYIKNQNEGIN